MAYSPLNDRLSDAARHRENRGRLAHAYARVDTEGFGVVEFEDRIDFDTTFVERPFISVGHQIDLDQSYFDAGDTDLVQTLLPQCTAYVTAWDQTSKDNYVGCWVAVAIRPPDIEAPTEGAIKIFHDFTFSAIAIKDVPTTA